MRRIAAVLLIWLGFAMAALADSDQDRARRAYEAGEIVSLGKVLTAVETDFEGEVIEVELEREDGKWIYEVELLTRNGGVLELNYNAATAQLESKGKKLDAARKRR